MTKRFAAAAAVAGAGAAIPALAAGGPATALGAGGLVAFAAAAIGRAAGPWLLTLGLGLVGAGAAAAGSGAGVLVLEGLLLLVAADLGFAALDGLDPRRVSLVPLGGFVAAGAVASALCAGAAGLAGGRSLPGATLAAASGAVAVALLWRATARSGRRP
jgi:hypothetical protein